MIVATKGEQDPLHQHSAMTLVDHCLDCDGKADLNFGGNLIQTPLLTDFKILLEQNESRLVANGEQNRLDIAILQRRTANCLGKLALVHRTNPLGNPLGPFLRRRPLHRSPKHDNVAVCKRQHCFRMHLVLGPQRPGGQRDCEQDEQAKCRPDRIHGNFPGFR